MNTRSTLLPKVALLLFAVCAAPAFAKGQQDSDVKENLKDAEKREAEFTQRMREAEERLAEAAKQVAELSTRRLEAYGEPGRYEIGFSNKPRMGINIETDGEEGPVDGVEIVSVSPGSAADDAGMRAGDMITAINGEDMSAESRRAASMRLMDFMKGVEVGDKLKVDYLRDGKAGSLEVEPRAVENKVFVWSQDGKNFTMPRMPEVHVAPEVVDRFRYSFGGWQSGWGDLEIVELTEGLGRYFGTDSGLLVISAPGTNDFKLQEGDVIQSIDGREPKSVDHCMRIFGSYQPGETLELRIMRDKRRETLNITMPDRKTSSLHTSPLPLSTLPARANLPAVPPLRSVKPELRVLPAPAERT